MLNLRYKAATAAATWNPFSALRFSSLPLQQQQPIYSIYQQPLATILFSESTWCLGGLYCLELTWHFISAIAARREHNLWREYFSTFVTFRQPVLISISFHAALIHHVASSRLGHCVQGLHRKFGQQCFQVWDRGRFWKVRSLEKCLGGEKPARFCICWVRRSQRRRGFGAWIRWNQSLWAKSQSWDVIWAIAKWPWRRWRTWRSPTHRWRPRWWSPKVIKILSNISIDCLKINFFFSRSRSRSRERRRARRSPSYRSMSRSRSRSMTPQRRRRSRSGSRSD